VVSRDGRAEKRAVDLGLADMDLEVGQAADGEHVALLVRPAAIARNADQLRGRWQTLTVTPGGTLTSTPTAVAIDDLAKTTQDHFEPARLTGAAGWVVLRNGVRQPDGVFAGQRRPAAAALLLRGPDELTAQVTDLSVPPPRGAGGRIYEAQREPALARARNGQPVGQPIALEVGGFPVGVLGVVVQTDLAWSGTHFLYPFHTTGTPRVASLLPVDCAP
jgi:hypothetical protein